MNLIEQTMQLKFDIRIGNLADLMESHEIAERFKQLENDAAYKEELSNMVVVFLAWYQLKEGPFLDYLDKKKSIKEIKKYFKSKIIGKAIQEAFNDLIYKRQTIEEAVIPYITSENAMLVLEEVENEMDKAAESFRQAMA